MVKYLRFSSLIRKLFLIYDFALDPCWISFYMRKIFFSFLSVKSRDEVCEFEENLMNCWAIQISEMKETDDGSSCISYSFWWGYPCPVPMGVRFELGGGGGKQDLPCWGVHQNNSHSPLANTGSITTSFKLQYIIFYRTVIWVRGIDIRTVSIHQVLK